MGIYVAVVGTQGFDPNFHVAIIKLAISYTLALAFVFTVVVTCLSMLGWVRFADPKQQRRLFAAVVLELAIGCIGVFFGFLNLNASDVKEEIQAPLVQQIDTVEAEKQVVARELESSKAALTDLQRQQQSLKTELEAGAVRLTGMAADRDHLEAEVLAATTARDAANKAKESLEASAAKTAGELADLEKRREAVAAELANVERQLNEANEKLIAERNRANDLETVVSKQATELVTVKNSLKSAVRELPANIRSRYTAVGGG